MFFRNKLTRPLYAFLADEAEGGAGGAVDEGEKLKASTEKEPSDGNKEKSKSEKAEKAQSDVNGQLDALAKKIKAQEKELEAFKKKEQEEADKQKSVEQRLAEKEAEIAKLSRTAMVERLRREGGFTDKVFDAVQPAGETDDEIKSSYEAYKKHLDEYVKAAGAKPGQGGGTEGGKPDGKANKGAPIPFLIKHQLVNQKQVV